MNNGNVILGVLCTCIGVIAYFSGVMSDPRAAPFIVIAGLVIIITGLISDTPESGTLEPTPPDLGQQVVKTLVICPGCGSHVSVETKFCPECGANLMPRKPESP